MNFMMKYLIFYHFLYFRCIFDVYSYAFYFIFCIKVHKICNNYRIIKEIYIKFNTLVILCGEQKGTNFPSSDVFNDTVNLFNVLT